MIQNPGQPAAQPPQPPICADCRHVCFPWRSRGDDPSPVKIFCRHPQSRRQIVSGEPEQCAELRGDESRCGQEGRWFEPELFDASEIKPRRRPFSERHARLIHALWMMAYGALACAIGLFGSRWLSAASLQTPALRHEARQQGDGRSDGQQQHVPGARLKTMRQAPFLQLRAPGDERCRAFRRDDQVLHLAKSAGGLQVNLHVGYQTGVHEFLKQPVIDAIGGFHGWNFGTAHAAQQFDISLQRRLMSRSRTFLECFSHALPPSKPFAV